MQNILLSKISRHSMFELTNGKGNCSCTLRHKYSLEMYLLVFIHCFIVNELWQDYKQFFLTTRKQNVFIVNLNAGFTSKMAIWNLILGMLQGIIKIVKFVIKVVYNIYQLYILSLIQISIISLLDICENIYLFLDIKYASL